MNLAAPWQPMPRHVESTLRALRLENGDWQPLQGRMGSFWMLTASPCLDLSKICSARGDPLALWAPFERFSARETCRSVTKRPEAKLYPRTWKPFISGGYMRPATCI